MRLELFFKSVSELNKIFTTVISPNQIFALNLTNKNKGDDLHQQAAFLQDKYKLFLQGESEVDEEEGTVFDSGFGSCYQSSSTNPYSFKNDQEDGKRKQKGKKTIQGGEAEKAIKGSEAHKSDVNMKSEISIHDPRSEIIIDDHRALLQRKLNICVHYSLKFQKMKSYTESYHRFIDFYRQAQGTGDISEILIVNGSGPKKDLNVISLLQELAKDKLFSSSPSSSSNLETREEGRLIKFGVAFNPYFSNEEEREVEEQRLREKLQTGLVSSIWLQFGSDTEKLTNGLEYIRLLSQELDYSIEMTTNALGEGRKEMGKQRNILDDRETRTERATKPAEIISPINEGVGVVEKKQSGKTSIRIVGSLFIPSKLLLAQQKFRPWNGVWLSEQYLSSVEEANGVTKEILSIYKNYGVEPLVESKVASEKDIDRMLNVLSLTTPSSSTSFSSPTPTFTLSTIPTVSSSPSGPSSLFNKVKTNTRASKKKLTSIPPTNDKRKLDCEGRKPSNRRRNIEQASKRKRKDT